MIAIRLQADTGAMISSHNLEEPFKFLHINIDTKLRVKEDLQLINLMYLLSILNLTVCGSIKESNFTNNYEFHFLSYNYEIHKHNLIAYLYLNCIIFNFIANG